MTKIHKIMYNGIFVTSKNIHIPIKFIHRDDLDHKIFYSGPVSEYIYYFKNCILYPPVGEPIEIIYYGSNPELLSIISDCSKVYTDSMNPSEPYQYGVYKEIPDQFTSQCHFLLAYKHDFEHL